MSAGLRLVRFQTVAWPPYCDRMIRGRVSSYPSTAGVAWVLAGVLVLALANRLLPVLRGGGLSSVLGYDDAVCYAGAVGLVHGRMPYRDFLLLHPPGVVLALAPVAAAGRWLGEVAGWEASRIVWMLMGCCTALLVAHILLPLGKLAAALGGGFYAVFPGAVLVERTTLLEGLTNFCLALALALLIPSSAIGATRGDQAGGRRWAVPVAAGALLGFAVTVKVWSVVPLVVVCVVATLAVGARSGIAVLLAALGTVTAVCLPFFVAAPAQMWRMVVQDQLGRERDSGLLERAAEIATMGRPPAGSLAVVVVVAATLALGVACLQAWRIEPLRVASSLLVCTVALLLASPAFFPHYLAILGVPVALASGAMVAGAGPSSSRTWRLVAGSIGGVALAVDVLALTRIESGEGVPATALNAVVQPAPGCLTADDPNTLLALGVVGRNIGRRCELVVDLGGYSHHLSRYSSLSRRHNQEWQRVVLDHLGSGHYAIATRFGQGRGLSPSTAKEIKSWRLRERVDGYEVRQPS